MCPCAQCSETFLVLLIQTQRGKNASHHLTFDLHHAQPSKGFSLLTHHTSATQALQDSMSLCLSVPTHLKMLQCCLVLPPSSLLGPLTHSPSSLSLSQTASKHLCRFQDCINPGTRTF